MKGCPKPKWKGDGFCDDDNNVASCDFDAGDCCEEKQSKWNHFCKECACLQGKKNEDEGAVVIS